MVNDLIFLFIEVIGVGWSCAYAIIRANLFVRLDDLLEVAKR